MPSTPLHCPALPVALSSTALGRAGCAGMGVWLPPHSPHHALQEAYTRVLMGNIDLSRLVFPSNTAGGSQTPPAQNPWHREQEGKGGLIGSLAPIPSLHSPGRTVESFARRALWDVGLNYGHGTGHGIGNFLSVHECRCHQHWCWACGLSYGARDEDRSSLGASHHSAESL